MDRREFVKNLALGTGCIVLLPAVTACSKKTVEDEAPAEDPQTNGMDEQPETAPTEEAPMSATDIPQTQPADWDPIGYNKDRGLAGSIPESYHADITGPEGEKSHLGKHLPFIPADLPAEAVPAGFIAIMWGDPQKGYTRHPNAVPNESNNMEGHWYDWIRVRKAVDGEAEELQSAYQGWPELGEGSNGQYAVQGGGDITADSGKNTIYLAALPDGCKPGDKVRVHAHCLTHGEYVDFITV